jgi:methylmalonyl-CoA mutase cobalamin-binding subunit
VLLPSLSLAKQDHQKGGLDDARSNFLTMSVSELLAEYSEYKNPDEPSIGLTAPPVSSGGPHFRKFPVVCIAANDGSDEITATMLAQLLEQAGFNTILLPIAAVTAEILSRLAQDKNTVVCISALPPFAFTAARSACLRVREQMPKNRILVGLWRSSQETEQLRSRFGAAKPTAMVSTLAEAVAQVTAWDESSPQRPIAGTTKGFIQHQSEHAGSRESTLLAE